MHLVKLSTTKCSDYYFLIQAGRVLPWGFKLHVFRIYKPGEKQKQDKCPEKKTLEGGVEKLQLNI